MPLTAFLREARSRCTLAYRRTAIAAALGCRLRRCHLSAASCEELCVETGLAARDGDQRDALACSARGIDAFRWLGQRLALGTVLGRLADLLVDSDPEAAAVVQGCRRRPGAGVCPLGSCR